MTVASNNEIIKLRERGQITIPEKIRKLLPWMYPSSLLQVKVKQDKVVISPLLPKDEIKKKELSSKEWRQVFLTFKKIRSSGRQIDGAKTIIKDRESH